MLAEDVLSYWQEKTDTKVRADHIRTAVLRRIRSRLKDGYSPDDLKRCVDFAMHDEFYAAHGYHKQPDVIWRNGERVASILERVRAVSSRPLPL
jgi:uncharacterized phage protein (TIGR02220 family)